jgi:hypothetical protein
MIEKETHLTKIIISHARYIGRKHLEEMRPGTRK